MSRNCQTSSSFNAFWLLARAEKDWSMFHPAFASWHHAVKRQKVRWLCIKRQTICPPAPVVASMFERLDTQFLWPDPHLWSGTKTVQVFRCYLWIPGLQVPDFSIVPITAACVNDDQSSFCKILLPSGFHGCLTMQLALMVLSAVLPCQWVRISVMTHDCHVAVISDNHEIVIQLALPLPLTNAVCCLLTTFSTLRRSVFVRCCFPRRRFKSRRSRLIIYLSQKHHLSTWHTSQCSIRAKHKSIIMYIIYIIDITLL